MMNTMINQRLTNPHVSQLQARGMMMGVNTPSPATLDPSSIHPAVSPEKALSMVDDFLKGTQNPTFTLKERL